MAEFYTKPIWGATLGYSVLLGWSIGHATRLRVKLVSLFRKLAGQFFH